VSALIEAAAPGQRFSFAQALSRGAAPTCPGRADSSLEPIGDTYLGDGSTQLAAALARRYPALKVKALYTGNPNTGTLEHTVAYDPTTGIAHDARGTFPSTAAAFAGYGANGDRKVTRDEALTPVQDPQADAYVQRHWGPLENGSGDFGDLSVDHDPDGPELDALLGGDPRATPTGRVLDEALTLAEAIYNEKLHPRWPPGSHSPTGQNISGQFMRVGQRFNKDGHEWEITQVAGGRVIAAEASGDVAKATTQVFDTQKVGDVENALPNATPAEPRILRSGFKSGTKQVIANENSLVVDADSHPETHDPAIHPSPLSKLTPEQWSHFGRVDQLYYNEVMDRFGAWEINGHKPPPIAQGGSQWSAKLSAITKGAPPDAVSTFNAEVSSLKGATRGNQLSGVNVFKGLMGNPEALAKAQAKYERFREYESDVNALVSWDLYNRLAEPDITVIHRAGGAEVFKKALQGNTSVLSGLSTSWKTGSWSEPNSFVFAMPVRNVAFFESLLGQGWGSGSSESELANLDRLKVGKQAGYYLNHEIQDPGYGSGTSQAHKLFKWLGGKLNTNAQGGSIAGALKKHFSKDDPYTVDLGQVEANFHLKKAAGAKTYYIPPDNVMADIEEKVNANPGHPAWAEQKPISEWPADMQAKPGMVVEKGGSQAGTRYLVIQNDALGPNEIQYVPLLTGSGDYDVNPAGGGYKSTKAKVVVGDDGKPLFFPLPPPPTEEAWSHDMASLAPSGPAIPVGQMNVGDKIAINDDHWEITKKTGGSVALQSLSDGSEGTVDSLWKTQKLSGTAAPFVPEVGDTVKLDDGRIADVVNVSDDGKFAEASFAGGKPFMVTTASLSEGPQLPKLTPQKGDTFENGGIKHTVTNVQKDGTVIARPFLPGEGSQKVQKFHPNELNSLIRPDDYEHGPKDKLSTMAPGTLVSGSPNTKRPYMVLGHVGTKTYLKNLDTGEVTPVSKNKSYPTLVGKGAVATTPAHATWKPGDKVNTIDLEPGDKFSLPGGQDLTLVGEATEQGTVGWQYEAPGGNKGWIPKDISDHATYLGKGEPSTPPPPVTVNPSDLMDAVEHGDLQAYKWHKGGGGQVYPKVSSLAEGEHFTDKKGQLWKVKQPGEHPIITDGQQLYTVNNGNLHVKEPSAGFIPIPDGTTPDLSTQHATPAPEPVAMTPNTSSLKELAPQPGDKINTHGHVWTIQSGSPTTGYTAKADDAELTQTFQPFVVPPSYHKAEPTPAAEPTPIPALPSFLDAQSVGPITPAHMFDAHEMAQRADGTLVYKKKDIQHGDHWAEVGGPAVEIPNDEKLTSVALSASIPPPGSIKHTGQSVDVHEMQSGQTFFAGGGEPWIVLGHGPAGLDAKNLKNGAILSAPADQHGKFELGSWNSRGGLEPTPPGPPSAVKAAAQSWMEKEGYAPGTINQIHELAVTHHAQGKDWPDAYEAAHINMKGYAGVGSLNLAVKGAMGEEPPTAPGPALVGIVPAEKAATDFLEGAGHTPSAISHLHAEAKANVATSGKYPASWAPATKWAQAYTDAYVNTYGEDNQTIDMGNSLFQAVKTGAAAPTPEPGTEPPGGWKTWGDVHVGDSVTMPTATAPFKVTADNGDSWTITNQKTGLSNDIPKEWGGKVGIVGHEDVPQKPTGAGTTAGTGIHPAMNLAKGHHMKIKTDGKGAEYEVMETPKPGDKTIKLQVMTKAGPGKVYDWKHYNKNILITKEAPAPTAGEMTPNDAGKSLEDLGLQKGDLYHDGGNTFKVTNVTKYNNIETENVTTGGSLFVHKGFVPESYIKTSPAPQGDTAQNDTNGWPLAHGDPVTVYGTPGFTYQGPDPEAPGKALIGDPNDVGGPPLQIAVTDLEKGVPEPPTPPPSAPIPAHGPQTLGDLNVGDKYKIGPHEWEVMQKDDIYTTVKNQDGDTIPMPHDTPFSTAPEITYKAPPTTGGSASGQLGGMPTVHDMPIDPYLWHKGGGGQTYAPINKLAPGEQFSDKSGNKYIVVKHNVKKLEDVTASTTVQGPSGGTFDVPTHFANAKGKTVPTRVYKLASTAPVPEYIEPQPEQPEVPGHLTAAQTDNLLTNVSTQGGDHHTNGWLASYANSGGYHVTSPGGVTHNDLSHDQAYGWMVHGAEPAAEPAPAPTPTTWDKLRVGDLINSGSGGSPFKVTADHGTHWEITSAKDGSSADIPKNSTLQVEKTGHESMKGPPFPLPVNDAHYKAQRIADQWLKQHKMPAEDIAAIHQKVADFLPGQDQWGPGEAYAQAVSGHTQFKTPGDYQGNPHELTKQIDQALQVGKLVAPHELGKGDVFSNPEGGHFEVTAKAGEATHFKKLSGAGATAGVLHDDSPVKYTLVSKGEQPILPSAEASAIPAPANDAHFTATNAADKWMLDNGVPSKTANWVHAEAAKQKQQHPNWGWGESYAAALPPEAMDDPHNLAALKDLLDQKEPPAEPVVEKLPPAAPKPGLGEMPDYTGTKLTPTGSAGGTTGAQLATDPTGKQWLIKSYDGNENRVATELLANSVYRSMGLNAADAGTLQQGGKTKLAYPLVGGNTQPWSGTDQAKMKALGQGVMTDALVGNWDFAGLEDDNVLWNGDKPTRIDQGGTFMYRAQGKPKEFGPVPVEVKSLLTGGGQGVKGVSVSEPEMRQQAAQIAATLTPEKIDQLVDAAPFANQKMKDEIRKNLKARVAWMAQFADGKHSEMLNGVKLSA
jgi:hypothetical protein